MTPLDSHGLRNANFAGCVPQDALGLDVVMISGWVVDSCLAQLYGPKDVNKCATQTKKEFRDVALKLALDMDARMMVGATKSEQAKYNKQRGTPSQRKGTKRPQSWLRLMHGAEVSCLRVGEWLDPMGEEKGRPPLEVNDYAVCVEELAHALIDIRTIAQLAKS